MSPAKHRAGQRNQISNQNLGFWRFLNLRTTSLIIKLLSGPVKNDWMAFLVGVFEENARLLQWLDFFVSSTRSVSFLCIMHFYHEYLVLHFERIPNL